MIQQQLRQLLPERDMDPSAALALLSGSAAAVVVWKWLGNRQIQKKMEEARRTRDEGVKKMAKVVQQFREQVKHILLGGGLCPSRVSAGVLQLLLPAHASIAFKIRSPGEMYQQPSTRGKAALGGRELTALLKLDEMRWESTTREM